jgi:hypothetical protein
MVIELLSTWKLNLVAIARGDGIERSLYLGRSLSDFLLTYYSVKHPASIEAY